ncbi:hypothetical protein F4804DRAFT_327899 [Jackrogersella minutella]|nr:hypothetical protein F4804DRAFT_327899 [Jackrogersella minutella]
MPERRDQYPVDLAFAVPGECSKRPSFDHQYIYEISPEGFRERCYLCNLPFHELILIHAGESQGSQRTSNQHPSNTNNTMIHTTRPEQASAGRHQEPINSPNGKKVTARGTWQRTRLDNLKGSARYHDPDPFQESEDLIEYNKSVGNETLDGFNAAKKKYGERKSLSIPAMDRMKHDISIRFSAFACQYFVDNSDGLKIPTPAILKRQPDRIDAPIKRDHKLGNILLQEFLVEHVLPGFAPNIQKLFKNKEMRFVQCVQARAPGSKVNVTELANYDTMTLSTITNPNTIPWNSNETHTRNRLYNAHILVFVEEIPPPSSPKKQVPFSPSQSSSLPSTPTPRRKTRGRPRKGSLNPGSSSRGLQKELAFDRTVAKQVPQAPTSQSLRKEELAFDGTVKKLESREPKRPNATTTIDLTSSSDLSDEFPSIEKILEKWPTSSRAKINRTNRGSTERDRARMKSRASSDDLSMVQDAEDKILVAPEPQTPRRISTRKRRVNQFLEDPPENNVPRTRSSPRKNKRLDVDKEHDNENV